MTSPKPIEDALKIFEDALNQLEALMNDSIII